MKAYLILLNNIQLFVNLSNENYVEISPLICMQRKKISIFQLIQILLKLLQNWVAVGFEHSMTSSMRISLNTVEYSGHKKDR